MAVIAAIVGSIAALTSTGVGLASYASQPGPPKPPAPTAPTQQQQLQKNEMVSQQEPNVVGQTSGLASPSYDSIISQILAGVTGQPGATAAGNAATGQQFTPANNAPTNAAVNGQQPSLSDFINNFSQ